ncbi:hypothetical protein DASC09_046540 [Saccharomycopsis crataegensis]|uniref:Crh-like protein n=1 Tax=Saccharomycopsis crataegensis TaxID=43959 RepID=A0AAV5QRF7_9ASCO|nr:hypothetical protein DASC09_046540 [Saccharomycopsis crataegensis]
MKNLRLFLPLSIFFLAIWTREFVPCNPLKDDYCQGINQALSSSFTDEFREPSSFFDVFSERGETKYTNDGLKIIINKRFDNPSIRSTFYILFGKVEVIAKSAAGRGIISSVFLQSDDLDEIDLEWIGSAKDTVQSNYFAKGDVRDYSRGGYHHVEDCHNQFHNYTIDWTAESLSFYIDNLKVRQIFNDEPTNVYGYPQTPMAVYLGTWVGGDPGNQVGTIQWAGGLTDFNDGPFTMEVNRIVISDYSSGKYYKYHGKSGDWSSIQSIDGTVNGRINQAANEFSILSSEDVPQNKQNVDSNGDQSAEKDRRSFSQFSGKFKAESVDNNSTKVEVAKSGILFLFIGGYILSLFI